MDRFFEVKGFRNLWGLAASGGRTVVTAGDYEVITMLTRYSAGLLVLLLARHLVLHWIDEYHALQVERGSVASGRDESEAGRGRCC